MQFFEVLTGVQQNVKAITKLDVLMVYFIIQDVEFNLDFHAKFGSEMARISAMFSSRHCHSAIIFFTFAPPRRAPQLAPGARWR